MHRKVIRYSAVVSGVLASAAIAILPANDASAEAFDADKVMNNMTVEQRSAYVSGVIEGLAIARYMKDGKQPAGMKCIYDWYYEEASNIRVIYDAFDRYPTYPPGSIIDVLVKQKCGD
jgi:hypothetical protein